MGVELQTFAVNARTLFTSNRASFDPCGSSNVWGARTKAFSTKRRKRPLFSFRFRALSARPQTHVPSSSRIHLKYIYMYCRTVRSLVTFHEEDSTACLFLEVRFLPMALCSPRDSGKSASATKLPTRNRSASKGRRASVDDEQSPCAPCGHPNPQDASRGRGCIIIVDVQEERAWFIFRPR